MSPTPGPAAGPTAARVVLLRDARWPDAPGTCCWRGSLAAALAGEGAELETVTWRAPESTPALSTPGSTSTRPGTPAAAHRIPPVPGSSAASGRHRTVLSRIVSRLPEPTGRALRETRTRLRGRTPAAVGSRPAVPIPGLAGAAVVVAEGVEAGAVAVAARTAGQQVWALVLPPDRVAPDEPSPWAEELRGLAGEVDGVLTDTDAARDVIERAVGPARPPVLLFPPLAHDRPCATCGAQDPGGPASDPADETAGEAADETAGEAGWDEPRQLALWRRLLAAETTGTRQALPYSFPAARLRGEAGPWRPTRREPWGEPAPADPAAATTGDAIGERWSAAAQARAARALLRRCPPVLPPAADAAPDSEARPRRVAVVGLDLSFIADLAARLDRRPDLDVTLDEWSAPGRRTPGVTEPLVAGADVLVAEWARPNAIWLSEVKRPDQLLVVRLHRFEIEMDYPRRIQIDNVDAVVHISPLMGRRIRDEIGWPAEKLVYIPNFVDVDWLDRPKLPGARFTLGFVGAIPSLKRLDLALDLLAALRQHDPRFTLLIRTRMPWTREPSWKDDDERQYFHRCFDRIEADPLLRGAVVFDAFGRDMAAWLRKVGHILSLSDLEGSHTALCEGMAAGCVPVARAWPGAAELYGEHWMRASTEDAAAFVRQSADADVWEKLSAQAKEEARRRFGPDRVVAAWVDLLAGRRTEAARHFPSG